MTTVGLIVLLACANVTNLLLASAASRRREIGTRLALGASRGRVVRQLLTESVLIGIVAGGFGLLVSSQVLPAFAALIQVPPTFDVSPDGLVYAFVGTLTIAVGIIAGLAPARFGRRGNLVSALQADQPSAPRRLPGRVSALDARRRPGRGVDCAAGARGAAHAHGRGNRPRGCRLRPEPAAERVGHAASIDLGPEPRSCRRILESRTRACPADPGVADAALVNFAPFGGGFAPQQINGRAIDRNETSPGYFETLGVRLIQGRMYTDEEMRSEAPVVVISASLAREFWGLENPVGSSLERVWGRGDARLPAILRQPPDARVIGVVADSVVQLRRPNAPTIYMPLTERSVPRLVVRTHADPRPLAASIQGALLAIDPSARATSTPVMDTLRRDLEGPRALALLAILVGATAVGLAVIGLFGVTAFVVEQRAHEMTVRRALGASDSQLLTLLFRESLRPVVVGLVIGLGISLLSGRVVQSVLYGVSSRDPLAIVSAVAILLLAAAAAVVLPARRATQVSAAHLLKQG